MSNENRSLAKIALVSIGIGTAAGFAAGVLADRYYQKKKTLTPDTILEQVKKAFEAQAPVEGTWIEYGKLPWKQFAVETLVYRGGVTCLEDDRFQQYEFIADAYTGTIIDIRALS